MSLTILHRISTTAGSSPAKVAMATVQAQMLSGRYSTESLCSHWKIHSTGVCLLSPACSGTKEDLQHILWYFCTLTPTREKLLDFTTKNCLQVSTPISQLITEYTNPSNKYFHHFLYWLLNLTSHHICCKDSWFGCSPSSLPCDKDLGVYLAQGKADDLGKMEPIRIENDVKILLPDDSTKWEP